MTNGNGTELARAPQTRPLAIGGVTALEAMSDADFAARLALLKKGQERMRAIQRELLVEGEDFGKVPGVQKPMLFKAGAEKLCKFYGLAPSFSVVRRVNRRGVHVLVTCTVGTGDLVVTGVGSANSAERKYRKQEPLDVDNTLVKMASKRAFVDATLRATATSGLFSQDLEEAAEDQREADTDAIEPILRVLAGADSEAKLEALVAEQKATARWGDLRRSALDMLRAEYKRLRDRLRTEATAEPENAEADVGAAVAAEAAAEPAPKGPTAEDWAALLTACVSVDELGEVEARLDARKDTLPLKARSTLGKLRKQLREKFEPTGDGPPPEDAAPEPGTEG